MYNEGMQSLGLFKVDFDPESCCTFKRIVDWAVNEGLRLQLTSEELSSIFNASLPSIVLYERGSILFPNEVVTVDTAEPLTIVVKFDHFRRAIVDNADKLGYSFRHTTL